MREYRKQRKELGLHTNWSRRYDKICATCKKSFQGTKNVKTCSRKCGHVLRAQNATKPLREERLRAEGKTEKEIQIITKAWKQRNCAVCGKAYYAAKKIKTCSRECGYKIRPNYKGGRVKTSGGYILIKTRTHPNSNAGGYVLEHRLVMEEKMGRYLNPWEDVHHINKKKDDNRSKNLQLLTHERHRGTVLCPHCHESFQTK